MISIAQEYRKRGNPVDGFTVLFGLTAQDRKQAYSLRDSLTNPNALLLKIKKLVCHETEDITGKDHVSLDVFCDGNFTKRIEKKMDNGDHFIINRTFTANERISLHLFENDNLSEDDFLGSFKWTVRNIAGVEHKTLTFSKDGAVYHVNVELQTSIRRYPDATSLIDAFEARIGQSKWTHITRKQVADQLRARIQNPLLIDQGPTAFCGPAAVLHEMVKAMPMRYVEMVIALYEHQKWRGVHKIFRPPPELLTAQIPVKIFDSGFINTTPEADWIALVCIRETINKFFSLDEANDTSSNPQAGAMCYEISEILLELLGYRNPDIFSTSQFARLGFQLPQFNAGLAFIPVVGLLLLTDWAFKEITGDAVDGLKEAINYLNKGGFAVMQINNKLYEETTVDQTLINRLTPTVSGHFVSLHDTQSVSITNKRVSGDVFTWGRTETFNHTVEDYERFTFAYVFAKPAAPL